MSAPQDMSPRERDTEARHYAQIEFQKPVVLEAGAGTGKTAVLVARIVAWSLGPGWDRAEGALRAKGLDAAPTAEAVAARVLRGIVAITFTEAAAAEMATRVGSALLSLRKGEPPVGLELDELVPPLLVHPRADALIGALDQLGVRTIHAFCRRLLAGAALDAGLQPGFDVDADGQRQAEVAREVLEAVLPEAFGEPFDPDFAVLADRGLGPRDVEEALLSLLGEGATAEDLAEDPLTPENLRALFAQLLEAFQDFAACDAGRLEGLGKRAKAASALGAAIAAVPADLALYREDAGDASTWEHLAEELAESFPQGELKRLRDYGKGSFPKSLDLGEEASVLAAHAARLHRVLRHVVGLDLELLAAGRRILHRLLAEGRELLRARGVETFGGLLRGARDLLVQRPEIAQSLREEIDQLLVDEFQDTDGLQCELVECLALQGPAMTRPGLFLVGDPKQSIYGWRGADLRAYEAFVDKTVEAGGRVLPLVVNFRSVPEVLEEVERIIAPVMEEARGLQPAFEALLPREDAGHSLLPEPLVAIEHWCSWGVDEDGTPKTNGSTREATELEARAVAADLQRLRAAGEPLGETALLLRSSGEFDVYLGALRDAGIPFIVEREEKHTRRREVMDAMAWIRCILDPGDVLALVATLRSSFVGVPDAAWLPLWERKLPAKVAALFGESGPSVESIVADVREVASDLAGRSAEVPGLERVLGWEENLIGLLGRLGPLRQLADEGPVDHFVEALRSSVALEASESFRHLGPHRLGSLDRVFRDLADALESTAGSAAAVLSFLRRAGGSDREHREGRPRSFEADAVHVLTIHKSKGLGFRHVYVLQTHKGGGRDPSVRTSLVRRGDQLEGWYFGAATPGMVAADEEREALEERERVRLLYVATTRAKERLVIAGRRPTTGPGKKETHAQLLETRTNQPVDLVGNMQSAITLGAATTVDDDGVLWRFPALENGPVQAGPAGGSGDHPSADEARRQEQQLIGRRERAATHQARGFGGTASATHGTPAPLPLGSGEGTPADRQRAMEIGTSLHRALEQVDFESPLEAWHAAFLESLAPQLEDPDAEPRARHLIEQFFAGGLAERLQSLAGQVIGKEVPLLLEPASAPEAPVGFIAGAIDLLYRCPEDGSVVVADYKTDQVSGPADLAARAEAYAEQGKIYQQAVQQALGLDAPPRFELWFLQAGQVVSLPA